MTDLDPSWGADEWPAVPQGLGPGDAPGGVTWRTRLCLVLPPQKAGYSAAVVGDIRAYAREKHLREPDILHTAEVPNLYKRKYRLIRTSHAKGIYLSAHRERVIVLALTGARVLLNPTEVPNSRNTVSIEEFVRYKCAYRFIDSSASLKQAIELIDQYPTVAGCDDTRDPRCLPFALFTPHGEYDLSSEGARQQFLKDHQASRGTGDLGDQKKRVWQRQENHTSDLLHVAGMTLPVGFHWNVQARAASVLANGWECWDLLGGGYTNIHPDATIRGGNRANRTYFLRSSEPALSGQRLPRNVRSRAGRAKSQR